MNWRAIGALNGLTVSSPATDRGESEERRGEVAPAEPPRPGAVDHAYPHAARSSSTVSLALCALTSGRSLLPRTACTGA